MSNRTRNTRFSLRPWQVFAIAGVVLLILFGLAVPAHAQEEAAPPESGCVSCHRLEYYVHDTGKWFCQCNGKMECACCHGGNPTVYTEAEAHLDMVIYPGDNNGAVCQGCHETDSLARVNQFAQVAGISKVHLTALRPADNQALVGVQNPELAPTHVITRFFAPWQVAALGLVCVGLAAVTWCGLNCWRKDRQD